MNPLSSHIASLKPYESARSLRKGDSWVFLDANESPYSAAVPLDGLPPVNRYPDPTADELREAIAAHYGVARPNVIAANGSDELIDLAIRSFVRAGRTAVAMSPSYGMYRVAADSNGTPLVTVPLRNDFQTDEELLWAALDGADLLFLCSPNNPTGTVLDRELIERILAGFSGLVVIDEAYGEFADAEGVRSSIELVRQGAENLIVLRTFSKAFGAAGLRLGYGIARPSIIDVLLRIKPPYNVSVLTQAAGLALWRNRAVMEENVCQLIAERSRLMEGCRKLGCQVFPTMANFFLFRPPEGLKAAMVYEDLIDRRRIVVRRFEGRPELEGLLRVSVGLPEQNDLFLSTLAEIGP